MHIAILDGQGGGIGRALIERLRPALPESCTLYAFGTNALATSAMLRAGAQEGATGENAIVHSMPRMQLIAGPIGIVLAHSMLGELTPAMAIAVASSPAERVLIPVFRCGTRIAGVSEAPLPQYIEQAAQLILSRVSAAMA